MDFIFLLGAVAIDRHSRGLGLRCVVAEWAKVSPPLVIALGGGRRLPASRSNMEEEEEAPCR